MKNRTRPDQPLIHDVLITGGGGYVGAALVPRLLENGYSVRVLDLFLFGEETLDPVKNHPGLEIIRGDIRDRNLLREALCRVNAVIHLACISNDPSFELNPALGRSINYESFEPLVEISKERGVHRFIYASSSSVYGVSHEENVTEDHPLRPITEYSTYKGLCESILLGHRSPEFTPVIVRPATLCGYSPRQRLDLTVNILTHDGVNRGKITVFGGDQMRPNLHIQDMVDLYSLLLQFPQELVAGKVYNAGHQNLPVSEIAEVIREVVERELPERGRIEIARTPSDDQRSYHISSEKIARDLGFIPRRTIREAARDLVEAFRAGMIPDGLTDDRYHNIKVLKGKMAELESFPVLEGAV